MFVAGLLVGLMVGGSIATIAAGLLISAAMGDRMMDNFDKDQNWD